MAAAIMKNTKILLLGVFVFMAFLLVPLGISESNIIPVNSVHYAAATFYGMAVTDLRQDLIGFRAMVNRENAYPKLEGDESSTHLPTTFLFVAPVAFFAWRDAGMLWSFLMLFALIATFRLFEFPWQKAIGYSLLSILWIPIMMSFGQFTILWLLLVTVAYRLQSKNPFWSGFFIGLASLIKLLPAIMMVPFILQKKWSSLLGFVAAWFAGLLAVASISYQTLFDYLATKNNIHAIILRSDNASLFRIGFYYLGIPGFIIALLLLGLFLFFNRKVLFTSEPVIGQSSWLLWIFLSVILMPVVWMYSLVPLLPILLSLLKSTDTLVKGIAWIVIILPIFVYPWGQAAMPVVAAMTIFLGVGVTLTMQGEKYRKRNPRNPQAGKSSLYI